MFVYLFTLPMLLAAIVWLPEQLMLLDFSFNQLVASASTMDTFSGQVANALAIQIELNLQLNIAVNFTIGCGF